METTFQVCAIVGGVLIVFQFLMTLIGAGGDHDTDGGGHVDAGHSHGDGAHHVAGDHHHGGDAGHGSAWFLSLLTKNTLAAAAAFFGLAGLAAKQADMSDTQTIAIAVGAGFVAMFIVAWLMRMLHKLNVDGTVRVDRAVGCPGTVYVRIPGAKAGAGKVHVNVLGRTQEYQALTAAAELAAGVPIIVVSVIGPDTVEVASALQRE